MANKEEFLSILYAAMAQPIGLVLRTSNAERARAVLYAARRSANDPTLAQLQIRISPFDEGDLVICKGQAPKQRPRRPALADADTFDLGLEDLS